MEQELRFGLDLGRLTLLKKKKLGRLSATFGAGFIHVLMDKKYQKHCSVRTKQLHKTKLFFFSFLKDFSKNETSF